jgi:hypothetical protein
LSAEPRAIQWQEIEDDLDLAASMMRAECARVEALNFEFRCDGLVYQQYASGRRVPNVYGLTTSRGLTYSGGGFPSLGSYDISSDNQIAIGVETMTATVGSARPWCAFKTTDADFKQRQRATRKGDYFYGLLRECGFYTELPNFFRDMLTWGWGVAKTLVRGKKRDQEIVVERCLPSEVVWDRAYSLIPGLSQPIYHQRFVLRSALQRLYPEFAEEIATAPAVFASEIPGLVVEIPGDFVALMEGWAPSPDGEKPGKHLLIVGDCCINPAETKMRPDEEHPFTFLVGYNVGPGWQYQGLVEQALADQWRLGKQNAVIWENQHRAAQNRWLVEERSNVNPNSLINRAAMVTTYKVTPPQLVVYETNPADLYRDRDETRKRVLERFGVNAFQSQGLKPGGLNSGEALREYGDQSSARFKTLAVNLEEFVVATTKKLDALCERVKPVVRAPGRRGVRKLTWDDVSLPKGTASVEIAFAISSLPLTPAGQIDKANELYQMGKIDSTTYARLTLNADVPAEIDAMTAARDAIESLLDDIIEDGKYVAPDDSLDLAQAFQLATTKYWRCVADKAPDDILSMLADWRDTAKRLADAKAPAPAAAAPPMGAVGAPPPMVPGQDVLPGPQPSQLPMQ